jgi:hypothetical protein
MADTEEFQADTEAQADTEDNAKRPKQADILINVAKEGAPLFRTPDGTGYADIEVNGHRETWRSDLNRSSGGCGVGTTK